MGFLSMRELLETIGGNLRPTDTTQSWLYRIAEITGLNYRVVRGVWHHERPSQRTQQILREAAEKIENENRNTATRLEQIARQIEAVDHDFHRQDVDTLRSLANKIRNLNPGK